MLAGLRERTRVVLAENERTLAALPAADREKLLEEGRQIYGEKPSLRKFAARDRAAASDRGRFAATPWEWRPW